MWVETRDTYLLGMIDYIGTFLSKHKSVTFVKKLLALIWFPVHRSFPARYHSRMDERGTAISTSPMSVSWSIQKRHVLNIANPISIRRSPPLAVHAVFFHPWRAKTAEPLIFLQEGLSSKLHCQRMRKEYVILKVGYNSDAWCLKISHPRETKYNSS